MITVIILCFQYNINKLEGGLFDIYRVYKYYKKINYNIIIYTDINKIENNYWIKLLLDENLIYDDIYYFNKEFIIVNELKQFNLNNIKEKNNINKIIFYYSGHFSDNNILFPNNELLNIKDLYNYFNIFDKLEKIFMIFDCCKLSNMNMTFKYFNNSWILNKEITFNNKEILIITSNYQNISISSSTGSLFTKYLFDFFNLIKDNYRIDYHFNKLIDFIKDKHYKYYQEINIYSSYNIDYIIYPWVIENKTKYEFKLNKNYLSIKPI